jgi:hypothetical protein
MRSAREHYAKAEELLVKAGKEQDSILRSVILAEAQVHATLALGDPGEISPARDIVRPLTPRAPRRRIRACQRTAAWTWRGRRSPAPILHRMAGRPPFHHLSPGPALTSRSRKSKSCAYPPPGRPPSPLRSAPIRRAPPCTPGNLAQRRGPLEPARPGGGRPAADDPDKGKPDKEKPDGPGQPEPGGPEKPEPGGLRPFG